MAHYWVDNATGNDSTGTGTRAAPWQTLIKALQTVTNGDVINLVSSGTAYTTNHSTAPQNISCTIRGTVPSTTLIECASAGSDAIRADGVFITLESVVLQGASTSGQSGLRLNNGARCDCKKVTFAAANSRALTFTGSANMGRFEECEFNSTTITTSGSALGEFVNCTGMASTYQTQDKRGTLGRTGARHVHTYLRSTLFYAADEFYREGNREVWVDGTSGSASNWREGTEALPLADIYDAVRLPGARSIILKNSGTQIYDLATSGNVELKGFNLDIIGCLDSNDLGPELRFSTVYASAWTLDTDATYYRTATTDPRVCWDIDVTDAVGNWTPLTVAASVAACKAAAGSFYYDSGATRLYVHRTGGGDPTSKVMVPLQDHGLEIYSGRIRLRTVRVRGCRTNGIFVRGGGVLDIAHCDLINNASDGLDCQFGADIQAFKVFADSNGIPGSTGDGCGVHKKSTGVFKLCTARYNQDDGFSPHDKSHMELDRCTSTNNYDRGFVAVDSATAEISDCTITNSGGQNISAEGTTDVRVETTTAHTPGEGQPNIRTTSGGVLRLRSVRDDDGALVTPDTSNGGTATVDMDDRDHVRREAINAAVI